MIKVESDCVNCGLPCIFHACSYYSVTRHYCDKCGDEIDNEKYIEEDGIGEYCEECYKKIYGCDIDGNVRCEECYEDVPENDIKIFKGKKLCKYCYEDYLADEKEEKN